MTTRHIACRVAPVLALSLAALIAAPAGRAAERRLARTPAQTLVMPPGPIDVSGPAPLADDVVDAQRVKEALVSPAARDLERTREAAATSQRLRLFGHGTAAPVPGVDPAPPVASGTGSVLTCLVDPIPSPTTPHDGNTANDWGWTLVDYCATPPACSGPASPPDCNHNDDDSSVAFSLPFTFNLFGQLFTSAYINNNGNLTFGSSYCTFTAEPFPNTTYKMVAPFWADVDTRGAGHTWYKYITGGHAFAVFWEDVGYYGFHADKLNTFGVVISDGTVPEMGLGNNVCFCYGDMQWTTGDASGGSGGFGGTAAVVGTNAGDGVLFSRVGEYDQPGSASPRGIDNLDNFSTCVSYSSNEPPSCNGGGPYASSCRSADIDGASADDPDGDELAYAWTTDRADVVVSPAAGVIPAGAGARPLPPTVAMLDPATVPCGIVANLTLTVTDTTGAATSCTTSVTFSDNEPPTVVSSEGGPIACLWPPNHWYVPIPMSALAVDARDTCTAVRIEILGCVSDQPDDAPESGSGWNGDGNTTDDCFVGDDGATLYVRSERCGAGPTAQDGRHYGIEVVATDECGNRSEPTIAGSIHVPHDQSPHERNGCLDPTRVGTRSP